MDPFIALGAAAAIVQLVGVATQITREAYSLVTGARESTRKQISLACLNDNDTKLCQDLLESFNARRPLDKNEALLYQVVETYKNRVGALRSLLQTLVVRKSAGGTKSIVQALKVVIKVEIVKRREIEDLAKEVEEARDQLSNMLLFLLQRHVNVQHDELTSCIARYGISNGITISLLKDEVLQAFEEQRQRMERHQNRADLLHGEVIGISDRLQQSLDFQAKAMTHTFASLVDGQQQILRSVGQISVARKCEALLAGLRFTEVDHRKNLIPEVAHNTFDWMFDTNTSTFAKWLESDAKLFCVFGKPGSGKSTLMKFLSDDPRARIALEQWQPTSTLITADHYFWFAWSVLQKSHAGLLRSLLYNIISVDPIVACCLCQQRWQGDERDLRRPWNSQELVESLRNIRHLGKTKVFLLVDGLDEFYPHDNHRLLVEDLKLLLDIPNLKLCVSSRPWPVFEKAFIDYPKMLLESHNSKDIRTFLTDEIKHAVDDASWSGLSRIDKRAMEPLLDDIVRLADGVFLWVHLVVSSLTERLRAGADLPQLRRCLREFPKDLEQYFDNMIYQRISRTWREGADAAKALKLAVLLTPFDQKPGMQDAQTVLRLRSFVHYWQLSQPDGLNDENFAFARPVTFIAREDAKSMLNEAKAYVNHCARDLLHVVGDLKKYNSDWLNITVDFAHRTVFDFITTAKMQTLIDERVPSHFLMPEMCSYLALAQTKFFGPPGPWNGLSHKVRAAYTDRGRRLSNPNRLAAFINSVFIVDQRPISEAICEEIDKVVIPGWYVERIYEDASDQDSISMAPDPAHPYLEQSAGGDSRTEVPFVSQQILKEPQSPNVSTHHAYESPSSRLSTLSQQPDQHLPALSTDDDLSFWSLDTTQPQKTTDAVGGYMSESEVSESSQTSETVDYTNPLPGIRGNEDYHDLPVKRDDIELVHVLGLLLGHRQSRSAPNIVADIDTRSLPELLFTALGVSSSGAGRTFAVVDINNDLIELVLGRGVDPNVTTSYFRARGRSAWHLFVRNWVRTAWPCEFEPDATRSFTSQRSKVDDIDLKAWSIARSLLLHGADIDGSCCLAGTLRCGRFYQEHDCCSFPVSQILNACVPAGEQSDLQLLLARARSSSADTTAEVV